MGIDVKEAAVKRSGSSNYMYVKKEGMIRKYRAGLDNKYLCSDKFLNHLLKKDIVLSQNKKYGLFKIKPQNGKASDVSFADLYKKYCKLHLPTLSLSSRVMKLKRCSKFTQPLLNLKMQDFLINY